MSKTLTLIGQVAEDQIAEWKKKYPIGIYQVICDGHVFYFRNPNRNEANMAISAASASAPYAVTEALIGATKIGGSDALLTDDGAFMGVSNALKDKLNGKMAVLADL